MLPAKIKNLAKARAGQDQKPDCRRRMRAEYGPAIGRVLGKVFRTGRVVIRVPGQAARFSLAQRPA